MLFGINDKMLQKVGSPSWFIHASDLHKAMSMLTLSLVAMETRQKILSSITKKKLCKNKAKVITGQNDTTTHERTTLRLVHWNTGHMQIKGVEIKDSATVET